MSWSGLLAELLVTSISRTNFDMLYGICLLRMFKMTFWAGLWWGNLRAGHSWWGIVQGQHIDHAASSGQPHSMDLWYHGLLSSLIFHLFLLSWCIATYHLCYSFVLDWQEDAGDEIKEAPKGESGEGHWSLEPIKHRRIWWA